VDAGRTLYVVSFDIDGTMAFGDPPGRLGIDIARAVAAAGHVIGSASDRVRTDQERLWAAHDLAVSFVGGKHHLPEVRERFPAAGYLHIGDTDIDRHFAVRASFEFIHVDDEGLLPFLDRLL
jgi:hypothetical protein